MKKSITLGLMFVFTVAVVFISIEEKKGLNLTEISAPVTIKEKSSLQTTPSVGVTQLIQTGEINNGELFGLLKDHTDTAISFEDGSPYICNGTNQGIGSGVDHISILQKYNHLFMVTQFECGIGAIYGMELNQNRTTGQLSVKPDSLEFISQKEEFGGWVHCAGVTTPWQTHLGSEEYEPDARMVQTGNRFYDEVTKHYWRGEENNPYYYGWMPEVSVDKNLQFKYVKHFSMGRFSHELGFVMPDNKTVYMSDDGTNVGLYMYVADKEEELSEGTLYAAKWIQTSNKGAGVAELEWIELGHASDGEIKKIVAAKIQFSDIFSTAEFVQNGSCPEGFGYTDTRAGEECLRVKEGQEKAAAFLETRRYAALKGATTEFRKEEGITYDSDKNLLYISMSQITQGMSDNRGDIQLQVNSCGAVYSLEFLENSFIAKNMSSMLEGEMKSYEIDSPYAAYSCAVDKIANPDNITYIPNKHTLVIGEDSAAHPNDFVWGFDTKTNKLTRIASVPYGAEATSVYWYENLNGWDYLSVVVQHPFGEVKESDFDFNLKENATQKQMHSSVVILGPFNK